MANSPSPTAARPAPPGDLDSLREVIRARGPTLPRRLGQVAEFALANPQDIALGTTARIAAAAGVQPSTLVRFAQALDYEGFSELQQVFQQRLRERVAPEPAAEPPSGLLGGFLDAASRSLDGARRSIQEAEFSRAVDLLAGAETIFLIARRRAFPVASTMAYTFGRMKVRSQLVGNAQGIEDEMLDLARPGDAAFVISFWPYSPDSVRQMRNLHDRGLPIIALTDSETSPLASMARVVLKLAEVEHSGLRSLSASMAVALALTAAVGERCNAPLPDTSDGGSATGAA